MSVEVAPLDAAATDAEIAHRMDRLPVTRLHLGAMLLCALGFCFDTLELTLGNVLAAVFSTPPHVATADQLSLLLSAVFIGAIVGAPLLGRVADRYGRCRTLGGVLIGLALTSVGAAASDGLTALTVCRVLSGLALGAYPPVMISYLTDQLPPRQRGMLIFVTAGLAALGPPIGIFLVRWLTPLQPLGIEAWRWGFIVGAVGSGLVGLMFGLLPESARWLQARGRHADAVAVCERFERSRAVRAAAQPAAPAMPGVVTANDEAPPLRRGQLVLIALLFLLSPWTTIAFPLLNGAVLSLKGFTLADTLLFVGLATFGPIVGTVLSAAGVDRIERRAALALCAFAMLVFGACFVVSDTRLWLGAASIGFNLFASLYVPVLNVYGAELFPTRSRATWITGVWVFNRIGAAIAPMLLLPLLRSTGPIAMFAVMAATLLLSIGLLVLAPRGRQRRSVA